MEKDPIKKLTGYTRWHKNHKDQGHWKSRKKMTDGAVGFTYAALINGYWYVGYKKYQHKKSKMVNKKKVPHYVYSGWKEYTTSSNLLNDMIGWGSEPKFYHIADWHTQGGLIFHEYQLMCRLGAILDATSLNQFSPKIFRPTGKALQEIENYYSKWGSL